MLTTRYKPFINRAMEPLAMRLARAGVSPLAITLACLSLTALVCYLFLRTRAVVPFCVAMGFVGALDGLDGAVARVSGKVTKLGAYFDAMADRYVETLVVLSAAQVTGYWALSLIVLAGSLLVSYAKARAAMEVGVSNQEWPDLMERAERGALFLVGLGLSGLVPWRPLGRDLFWWTLLILAVLVHATVWQRIARARRLILTRS